MEVPLNHYNGVTSIIADKERVIDIPEWEKGPLILGGRVVTPPQRNGGGPKIFLIFTPSFRPPSKTVILFRMTAIAESGKNSLLLHQNMFRV